MRSQSLIKLLRFSSVHWRAVTLFFVLLLIILWLAVSSFSRGHDIRTNPPTDPPLEPWMTARFVGLSYKLPRGEVAEALALGEGVGGRQTIAEIRARLGLTLEELTQRVRAHARDFREEKGLRPPTDGDAGL